MALTSLSNAQPTAWTNCGGTVETRTWTGAGSDSSWTNGDNWSGSVAPDCNDNVIFSNASGTKPCLVQSNVVCGNITMGTAGPGTGYTGRLIIQGTNTFSAKDIVMNGGHIAAASGMVKTDHLSVLYNGYFGATFYQAAGQVICWGGGTLRFGAEGVVDFGDNVEIQKYGAMFAPSHLSNTNNGVMIFRKSLLKNNLTSFSHRNGIVRFLGNGTAMATIDLSPGTDVRGTIKFYICEIDRASGANTNMDNLAFASGTIGSGDTITVERRLTLIDGDMTASSSQECYWNILDTLELNGEGDQDKCDGNFRFTGAGNADFLLNNDYTGNTTNWIHVDMWSSGNVQVTSTSASYTSRAIWHVENGTATFDANKNMTQAFSFNQTGGFVNLPSSATFSFSGENLYLTGGTWNPGAGKFVFARTVGNIRTDFDVAKEFNDLEINMPSSTASAPRSIITTGNPGNDNMLVKGDFNFIEGAWRGDGNDHINIEGDATFGTDLTNNSGSNNVNDNSFRFVGSGNSTLNANGVAKGTFDIEVAKDNASDKVIVTTTASTTELLGGSGCELIVDKGVLEFDGNTNVFINGNDLPGIVINQFGKIVAPANKIFETNGSWATNNDGNFDPNGGTFRLSGAGTLDGFNQNGAALKFNNLEITKTTGAVQWFTANDKLDIAGNFDITTTAPIVRTVGVNLKGNYHSNATNAASYTTFEFSGNNVQEIDAASLTDLRTAYVKINGAGVKLITSLQLGQTDGRLDLTAGNVNMNGQSLEVVNGTSSWRIIGGSSSSYIFGGAFKVSGGGIGGSPGRIVPIGSATNYRPVNIRSVSTTFTVEYFEANFGDDDETAPLTDQNSANAYWTITGNGNHQVDLSTNGAPSYTDLVVARYNSTSGSWETRGGGTSLSGFVSTTAGNSATGTWSYTLGQDPPAPISLSTKEVVSGQELNTQNTTTANSAVAAAAANVAFNVYPNPVNDILNVRVINANKGVVVLSDIQGKVYGTFNAAEVKSINFAAMSAGVYMVTFTDGVNKIAHRVVKN